MSIPKLLQIMRDSADSSGSLPFIEVSSTDGLTYTGTSKGVKEYKVGMLMIIQPNMTNIAQDKISNITININDLGAMRLAQYTVKKRGVANALGMWSTGMAVEAGFLYANEPFVAQIQQDSNGYILLPTARGLYFGEFANGTFGSNLQVSSSTSENGILRNIFISPEAPDSSSGVVGDVWIQYEE